MNLKPKATTAKTRGADKPVHLTELQKQNLARFGCAFKDGSGALCIDWRGRSVSQASEAEIHARVGKLGTELGPLVLLAFEISPVRPLPHYCYFPFDLGSEGHRRYPSRLTETGEIKLRFIAAKETIERTHQLTPFLTPRAAEVYADALQGFERHAGKAYDSEGALRELERWVRIPQFPEHFLTVHGLAEPSRGIEEAVRLVPNERREATRRIVRGAV